MLSWSAHQTPIHWEEGPKHFAQLKNSELEKDEDLC